MGYFESIVILICIYLILTASLDLLIGYTGLLSLGHASFLGISAYTTALLATKLSCGFLVSLLASCLLSALIAVLVAIPMVRLRGDYFILGTFAFSVIASSILENWVDLTNGPYGIYGIPAASIFGWTFRTQGEFLILTLILTVLALVAKQLLVTAPFGTALKSIREDETAAASLGNDATRLKLIVFGVSGFIAGVSGTLLAFHLRFIDPSLFTFRFGIFLIAVLFVGGSSSLLGNILGPALLVLFPEALRFIGLSGTDVPFVQKGLYGLLLIAVTIWRPQGLAGAYRFR